MDKEDKSAMRVLLLKNYPSASPSDFLFIDSFLKNIQRSRPEASLDVCCVANGETIPALSEYGLVVLSGGRINLLEDAKPLWVLQVLDMIRALASEKGGPKLLGICWGHQAVHYALGGKLDWLEVRPRIGVQEIQLTPEGQNRFHKETLSLHKYHVRYVAEVAPSFIPLAQLNEISFSSSGKILTFQGHPEMTIAISKGLSGGDDGTYKPHAGSPGDVVLHNISAPHDGEEVWDFIIKWASEGNF